VKISNFGLFRDCSIEIECAPTQNCNFVERNIDKRNCRKCLVKSPLGGCAIRGNDPVCEASKASQNALYEAELAARKLNCEKSKAISAQACQQQKNDMQAACSATKNEEESLASDLWKDRYESIIKLAEAASKMNISNKILNGLSEKLSFEQNTELLFVQYTNYETFFLKAYRLFNPDKYVDRGALSTILGNDLSDVFSIGNLTFVDIRHHLTVADVLQAVYTEQLYNQLGSEGISNLVASGLIDVEQIIQNKVIEACDLLEQQGDGPNCVTKVELYL